MRKTCTNCGNQSFEVELNEYDAHARTTQSTNLQVEVSQLICDNCGEKYNI